MNRKTVIGISGESGSGKTQFCREFMNAYPDMGIKLISADEYFKKELPKMKSPMTGQEYEDWNSPDALNYKQLIEDVREAAKEEIVLVEGAYIFLYDGLRELLQFKIFVETDIELRMYRRIKRNMEIFGTPMEEIAKYYIESAKFREQIYATPSKIYADIIFNGAKSFDTPIEVIKAYLTCSLKCKS